MPNSSEPDANAERIERLFDRCTVDVSVQRELDSIAGLASYVCGTRAAVLRLADGAGWRVASSIGLQGARDIRCAAAFCAHAMHDLGLVEVPDAFADPRLRSLDVVCCQPWIRSYFGVPLVAGGQTPGAIAVFDRAPQDLAIEQHWALRQLADIAVTLVLSNQRTRRV